MPRHHKRIPGSRAYLNYTPNSLEEALEKIVGGTLSIREASKQYNIPFGTLYNKYKGKHGKKHGRPSIFSKAEEVAILASAAKCADWGFPLSLLDIRMLAKYYLDRKGKMVAMFRNNVPGIDWVYSVLERHKKSYGQRLATNIKRARASVSRESLSNYFDNLEKTINDLPASNIFNYDESNMSDDPGKKRGIYRRGVKYPEKVMNHSKSCTTIMVCGSADGTLLPPYIIYKSIHLYNTWKENGPRGPPCCEKPCCSQGTRFNRTSSGWIDGVTFRDWFMSCFLPHAKRLEGRKVLIGDNLSSHMDADVLSSCTENNIDFVCLVPNSTHLCQPLDVGFFRPMKEAWRATLTQWKLQNLRMSSIPKDTFPNLLNKTLKKMDEVPERRTTTGITSAIKRNLINSFHSTGIFPLDRQHVLKRLPPDTIENADPTNEVENALTTLLKEQRFGVSNRPQRRKKRLQVAPGASISTVHNEDKSVSSSEEDVEEYENAPSSSKEHEELRSRPQRNRRRPLVFTPEQSSSEQFDNSDNQQVCKNQDDISDNLAIGQYVLVKFSSRNGKKSYKYVCKIKETCPEITVIGLKSLKNKHQFKLIPSDISEINMEDIIKILSIPLIKTDSEDNTIYEFSTAIDVIEA